MSEKVKSLSSSQIETIFHDILEDRKIHRKLIKKKPDQFYEMMLTKYNTFAEDYPGIYKKTVEGTMNKNMFQYMLQMMKQVESKSVTEHNASVKIGEMLVNKYVKPIIKDNKLDPSTPITMKNPKN
tara:strand:- start:13 stop:390 length:378 start_codon:yes stop_codon:yes gene_type:complete